MIKDWKTAQFVCGFLVTASLAFYTGFVTHKNSVRYKMSDLQDYKDTYLWKTGGTTLVPNANFYRLFSADGGKNWYALENPSKVTDEVKILGTADKIYPGLLKSLHAMDVLNEYIKKNGPLTFSEGRREVEKKLLEDAGFSVKTEKK